MNRTSLLLIAAIALGSCGSPSPPVAAAPVAAPAPAGIRGIPFDGHVVVDQFGYRPDDQKVAVLRDPHVGFDSSSHFTPGARYQVRSAADGAVVAEGAPQAWHGGDVEASSGDAGWWFDFSSLKTEGTYFIFDTGTHVRSATFRVAQDVYQPVLKTAVRTFFYQRSGFAKQSPWAEDCWVDDAAYIGRGQDLEARDITDRDNPAKARNVFGGWFDAGDTNKYVTFAAQPVHQLLGAYEENTTVFTDDYGIPESGNGIPDLLDEVKWEIDWLRRMQNMDGSAALKVGTLVDTQGTLPSKDHNPRYYIPRCTSATIAVAGMFAHAALTFGTVVPLATERMDLQQRAIRAWRNFTGSPRETDCDNGTIKAGDADWSAEKQGAEAVVAAIYLFALTGSIEYDNYIKTHYRETRPYRDFGWSRYDPEEGEALLYYARLPDADRTTADAILADKAADIAAGNHVYGFLADDDLYRSFMHDGQYHWGSNQVRANYGNTNLDAARTAAADKAGTYLERAKEVLHYFHGVNPFAMVYLSNMSRFGATRSANRIYHTWFWQGTRWGDAETSPCGPVPGFVPGGPNAAAVANGVPQTLVPPAGQPPQKSYRDWNTGWPEASWAITEPGIYYEAAYIKLLSNFAY